MKDPAITARNLARYQRRYAGHSPAPARPAWKYEAEPVLTNKQPRNRPYRIPGFVKYMQQVVRMRYGEKGKWGHGKYQSATKSGPGRRPLARIGRIQPSGNKLRRPQRLRYHVKLLRRIATLR